MTNDNVCPHGVPQDLKLERTVVNGALQERYTWRECLLCSEAAGLIVLYNPLPATGESNATQASAARPAPGT